MISGQLLICFKRDGRAITRFLLFQTKSVRREENLRLLQRGHPPGISEFCNGIWCTCSTENYAKLFSGFVFIWKYSH